MVEDRTIARRVAETPGTKHTNGHGTSDEAQRGKPAIADEPIDDAVLSIEQLSLWYGEKLAIEDVSLEIPRKQITALIAYFKTLK